VCSDPVRLGLFLQVGDCRGDPRQTKRRTPEAADRLQSFRPALVEPEDGRPQRLTLPVEVDHRAALGRQGQSGDPLSGDARQRPQAPARLADSLPEDLGVLLSQARRGGEVRVDHQDLVAHHRASPGRE